MLRLSLSLLLLTIGSCLSADEWIPLFNGENLDGWTIKVAKHDIGENYAETFRIEDGVLKVSYENYGDFDMQVAHLYSNQAYSHYRLRLEYRFEEGHADNAPFWIERNSGVMLHSQSPLSMYRDQAFPVSVEAQFLAEGTQAGTQTGNAATPGTHLEQSGELVTDHIVESNSRLHPMGQWIQFEAEIRGHDEFTYRINGDEVLRFQHPQLDPEDEDAKRLIDAGATLPLSFGHIALQAEGQNVWFRNIEIQPLEPGQ